MYFVAFIIVATWFQHTAGVPNLVVGTQEIYGPTWNAYNFTNASNVLAEQRRVVTKMGGNQMKIKLSGSKPGDTCMSYHIEGNCEKAKTLTELAKDPAISATFADPDIRFYHVWMYTFSSGADWLKRDWTNATLAAEKQEVKELGAYLLETYGETDKVFMCGNWEGDWMLMGASGCKNSDGTFNRSCDPSPEVIERMVQWGQVRQAAFDEARAEYSAKLRRNDGARIVYYMEFNLGPEAVEGRPGMINSVLERVNPDLASYSSYSTTNAYQRTSNVTETDVAFHKVLDLANAKLANKKGAAGENLVALGFLRRVFVGEYGTHQQDSDDQVRFVKNVTRAAVT